MAPDPDPTPAPSSTSGRAARWAWPVVGVLSLWALVLRWPGITAWWFNPDEAIYHAIATAPLDAISSLIQENAHPPLYYWLLWILARVSDSRVLLRLPALLAGVALVPVMFLLVRRYAGSLAGVIAALLVCLSPGAGMLSQVIRPYQMQSLCLAGGLLGLLAYLQEGRRRQLALYLAGLGCALLLHYSTFVVLAGVALVLFEQLVRHRLDRRRLVELAVANGVLLLLAVVLYLSHIDRRLQGSEMQQDLNATMFRSGFIHQPADVLRTVLGALTYVLGGNHFGALGTPWLTAEVPLLSVRLTLLSLAFLVLMAVGIARSPRHGVPGTYLFPLGILLAALCMSALGQYPLGKSRHSVYLTLVFVPLVASGLAGWLACRYHLVALLGAVFLISTAVVLQRQALAGGLSVNPPGLMAEMGITVEEAQAVQQLLTDELPADALVITDWQTYQLLCVLLGPSPREIGLLAGTQAPTKRIGGRLFIFAPDTDSQAWLPWSLPWQRDSQAEPLHLRAVLDALEGDDILRQRLEHEDLWLVQGGWSPNPASTRRRRARRGQEGSFCIREVGGRGLGAFLLDRAAYRAYLAGSAQR